MTLTKHKRYANMDIVTNHNQRHKGAQDMKKTVEKEPKQPVTVSKALGGVWGVIMAFVIASIAYSTYVVAAGTTGLVPKLMLIPQAVFAAIVVIYKFAK